MTENPIAKYLDELAEQLRSGHAREHAYRPALERLMSSFDDTLAVNDPARSENGNPDFVFLKKSNKDIILGYAEAKDITVDLDKTLKTEQLRRYAGYDKLFLTNYRDFVFLASGEEYLRISLGKLNGDKFEVDNSQTARLVDELGAFLARKPEAIKSGKRLAVIMGGKARRIRDNVRQYLDHEENERNIELEKIYGLMKTSLVHDLTKEQFADLYAQTLVYGLFAARYNDGTPDDFDRREAVEAVPKTNPFLRQFFNHIAGADFDARLRYIVDELCEVFAISDIRALVRNQATKFAVDDEQDLTIHFYEDFLKEYDPVMRQKMGVYYTPVPVVRYIVRSVDRILKEEFGINKGLASSETVDHWVETGQDHRTDKRQKAKTGFYKKIPRVQVLDPAVGTATFLNETIKHIYKDFEGQEGRWSAYVKDNLMQRLYGFELMMAPYTIAHLKLSMTLAETGAKDLTERLGIYLTNTLEEGIPLQQDLFSIGLASAVSEESRHAAEIKSNQPIMVVVGNPPYSGISSNETPYANSLIDKYKVESGGQQKLQERKHWLNDDYVKFLAFAENMIAKNGSGVVAMITNNGYLDNPTFRGLRWHLANTFDKIYVLDLHGNAKKKEAAPDGSKDENVFNIMQGVGIIVAVKNGSKKDALADIYHTEIFGKRPHKFNSLNKGVTFKQIQSTAPNHYFVPKDDTGRQEYENGISVNQLFMKTVAGIVTARDNIAIDISADTLAKRVAGIADLNISDSEVRTRLFPNKQDGKYLAGDSRGWKLVDARKKLQAEDIEENIKPIRYRPFDSRYIYYSPNLTDWGRFDIMPNLLRENIGLSFSRNIEQNREWADAFVVDGMITHHTLSIKEVNYLAPLYLYHENDTKTPNFNTDEYKRLTENLTNPTPEGVFDYIYAVLNSPSYRTKYAEFLKIDFPRLPVPTQDEFSRLVPLGRELRELHLMKSRAGYSTTFPAEGDNMVEKLVAEFPMTVGQQKADGSKEEQKMGRVYINDTQYFGNVPELAWNFYIGGYQPAQKWLKDRKGRRLSDADLEHYQEIIKILLETDRIMKQIG